MFWDISPVTSTAFSTQGRLHSSMLTNNSCEHNLNCNPASQKRRCGQNLLVHLQSSIKTSMVENKRLHIHLGRLDSTFAQSCTFFTHIYLPMQQNSAIGCWDNLAKINSSKGFINVNHLTNSIQSVMVTKEFTLTASAVVSHSMKDSHTSFIKRHCLHYSISWWH